MHMHISDLRALGIPTTVQYEYQCLKSDYKKSDRESVVHVSVHKTAWVVIIDETKYWIDREFSYVRFDYTSLNI